MKVRKANFAFLLLGLLIGITIEGWPSVRTAKALSQVDSSSAVNDSNREIGWNYDEKGRKQLRVEMENGPAGWVRQGLFQRWYPNGNQHVRGMMQDDAETGEWFKYHENGQLKKHLWYVTGKIHGPYKSWYEDGTPSSIGQFENGKPAGEWQAWTPDGSVDPTKTGRYENGARVQE